MKVKALTRSQASTTRASRHDLRPTHRNLDPAAHPMARAREYTRAVTAAKLDRMFAQPFVGELAGGHADAVTCLALSRTGLCPAASGAADGTVRVWDLATRRRVASLAAHARGVSGLAFDHGVGGRFYSCGEEGTVKAWSAFPRAPDPASEGESDDGGGKPRARRGRGAEEAAAAAGAGHGPHGTYRLPTSRSDTHGAVAFHSIDHHWSRPQFATASSDAAVHLWDPEKSTPVATFDRLWGGDDTVTTVRYNPAERDLLAHCSNDRGVGLHDTRAASALQKTVLSMKSNCLEWNPMEPYMFVVGNEDHNAYAFDMRKLHRPTGIYRGHVGAVMSVAWSPTGTEVSRRAGIRRSRPLASPLTAPRRPAPVPVRHGELRPVGALLLRAEGGGRRRARRVPRHRRGAGRLPRQADAARLLRGVHGRPQVRPVGERRHQPPPVEGAGLRAGGPARRAGGGRAAVPPGADAEVRAPAGGAADRAGAAPAQADQEADAGGAGAEGEAPAEGRERGEALQAGDEEVHGRQGRRRRQDGRLRRPFRRARVDAVKCDPQSTVQIAV